MDAMTAHTLLTGEQAQRYSVIDVRSPQEYAMAHIPHAVNVPLQTLATATLPKDRTLIVLCASGNRSGMACVFLREHGYTCANLAGGIGAWMAHGLPVVRGGGVG